MDYQSITVKQEDEILEIFLNRPDVRNAFNSQLIFELTDVFKTLALSPQVKVITLRGEGPVFCAGGDVNWMRDAASLSKEENLKQTRALVSMFRLMNECPKPIIGAIHGAAIGGGVGLVSVCDIAIATEETIFSLSEVRLGLIPACIAPFVISKIGPSFSRELFLSAERFKTPKAKTIGLVHHVVEDMAELKSKLVELTSSILHCGSHAISSAKELISILTWPEKRLNCTNCYDYCAQMLADLRVSEEAQEGVAAFLEKRAPSWLPLSTLDKG